jgi:hypothetical protein
MLSPEPPYLTAARLGLSKEDHWALVEVQRRLEYGELLYRRPPKDRAEGLADKAPCAFNMMYSHCGTVACFGGWMAILLGYSDHDMFRQIGCYVTNHRQLHDLFYPLEGELDSRDWDMITVGQTLDAVKHYRLTGDANEAWRISLG